MNNEIVDPEDTLTNKLTLHLLQGKIRVHLGQHNIGIMCWELY